MKFSVAQDGNLHFVIFDDNDFSKTGVTVEQFLEQMTKDGYRAASFYECAAMLAESGENEWSVVICDKFVESEAGQQCVVGLYDSAYQDAVTLRLVPTSDDFSKLRYRGFPKIPFVKL